MDMVQEEQVEQDEDVNRIVKSINELSSLFKQLNSLVIEQGTVIDRIDYNLEQAEVFVGKGKKELVKVSKNIKMRDWKIYPPQIMY